VKGPAHAGLLRFRAQAQALTVLPHPQADLSPDACTLRFVGDAKLALHGLEPMRRHRFDPDPGD
jgi:hypothetical protein